MCGNVHTLKSSTTAPPLPHINARREILLMYVLILKLLFMANLFRTERQEEEVYFFFFCARITNIWVNSEESAPECSESIRARRETDRATVRADIPF